MRILGQFTSSSTEASESAGEPSTHVTELETPLFILLTEP